MLYNSYNGVLLTICNDCVIKCVTGACFDWFPVACATPKKKEEKGKKKKLRLFNENVFL